MQSIGRRHAAARYAYQPPRRHILEYRQPSPRLPIIGASPTARNLQKIPTARRHFAARLVFADDDYLPRRRDGSPP